MTSNETKPLEEEKPLEISESQVKDFVSHIVWREIVSTIEDRIKICNHNLANNQVLNEIIKEQGELLSLQFLLTLPQLLVEEIRKARSDQAQIDREEDKGIKEDE